MLEYNNNNNINDKFAKERKKVETECNLMMPFYKKNEYHFIL